MNQVSKLFIKFVARNKISVRLKNSCAPKIMAYSSDTFKKLKVFNYSTDFKQSVKVVTEPLVSPADNEILLKNLYVGINATDINITAGRYFAHDEPPYEFGIEALSEVVDVGKSIENYSKGQFVVIKCGKLRAYSQYLYANANDSIKVVPQPNPEYLVLLGTSGLTAAIGLFESARLTSGETILVTAAAGGVGHIVAQLAKLSGCHVIALCSSAVKKNFLQKFGCDRIINYKEEDLDAVLQTEYPKGIDVIWETVGTPIFELLFKHIARKGRLMNVGATSGYKTVGYAPINIPDFLVNLHYGAKTVIGFLVMDYKDKYEHYIELLMRYFENGQIKLKYDLGDNGSDAPFNGLEAAFTAIEYLHSGLNIGKVLIKL